MRKAVRQQRVPAQDDEAAQVAVRESDQHASEQCLAHEFVLEWLEKSIHAAMATGAEVE
jgi:hypothetical protein